MARAKLVAESPTTAFPDSVSLSKWLIELKGWIATSEMRAFAALASRDALLVLYQKLGGRVVIPDAPAEGQSGPSEGHRDADALNTDDNTMIE